MLLMPGLYELRNERIKFPETLSEVNSLIATFADLTNLPNVVGTIDDSHVRIKAPNESAPDYFSRYQQHDFITQAIVDGRKIFIDFACGFLGSMHDTRVLRRSTIFQKAEQGDILIQPPYLLGDSAYPLSPWLMKPYPEGTRDPREITFNKELSSGIFKTRWRILLKRFDSKISFAIRSAVACAVLHNICIRSGDEWEEDEGNNDCCPGDHAPNVIRDGEDIREILKRLSLNVDVNVNILFY